MLFRSSRRPARDMLLKRFVWFLLACLPIVAAQTLPAPVTAPAIYTHGRIESPSRPDQPSFQLPLTLSWAGSALTTYWSGSAITVSIFNLSYWQPQASIDYFCLTAGPKLQLPLALLCHLTARGSVTLDERRLSHHIHVFRLMASIGQCSSQQPTQQQPSHFRQLGRASTILL